MAATITAPVYVQTQFVWDEPQSAGVSEIRMPITSHRTRTLNQRRGGCEHVGSPLVEVLGNYGISLDDLLTEIERLKAST